MKPKSPPQPTPAKIGTRGRGKTQKIVTGVTVFFVLILGGFWAAQMLRLQSAAAGSVDAILVLGGSIKREIYVTQFARENPDIPILIS
ncbi:MAG: hypothetical protein ACRC8Y_23525, partial [Chroococcales cyanobacterium]